MGAGYSQPASEIREIDNLMTDIQSTAQSLSKRYSASFADPNYCKELAVVYAQELTDMDSFTVDGLAYKLGMSVDGKEKHMVCRKIAENYISRIYLIKSIENTLPECYRRLNAMSRGPVCESDPEIFEQSKCKKWKRAYQPPPVEVEENSEWYTEATRAFSSFNNHLYKMKNILTELKDYGTAITDERLVEMGTSVKESNRILQEQCIGAYRKAMNVKTYSKDEAERLKAETPENLRKELHRAYGVST